jgi:hypothetical protein
MLDALRLAVGHGTKASVLRHFAREDDATYFFNMAGRIGGISKFKVNVIPVPPGWKGEGIAWAIFHTFQEIEQDHDTVYPIIRTEQGWKLGKEIPEWFPSSHKVKHARMDVTLFPNQSRTQIITHLDLEQKNPGAAPLFRLNDVYEIRDASSGGKAFRIVVADDQKVPQVREGDVLRAGGLLIPWTTRPLKDLDATYVGAVNHPGHDKILPNVVHITANWVPNLGRLPFTTATRITGPREWPALVSEGNKVSDEAAGFKPKSAGDNQVVTFKCDIPISYPKVNGGAYKLAAEGTDNGRTFRAWHFTVDKARAEKDVQTMINFCRFFDDKLGPFPFKSYDVFDGSGYYGIESYSYTILAANITNWATSHEMGHTYFGGLVPSAYTRDTWNEGMTQYVDSILFLKNADGTLQNGLRTIGIPVPLSKMDIAWEFGSATYFRGAYVMNILAAEIGLENVYSALRAIIKDRIGKDTVWADLRPYFERASGKQLDWFWNQWINNATFPTLSVREATVARKERTYSTYVAVRQTGTPAPFRLRFSVKVRRGAQVAEKIVTMSSPEGAFTIESNFAPVDAVVEVFPHTLGKAGSPVTAKGG